MKLVKQRGRYDCGLACLAMVLGLGTLAEAQALLGRDPEDDLGVGVPPEGRAGVMAWELCYVFWQRGVQAYHFCVPEAYEPGHWMREGAKVWHIPELLDVQSFLKTDKVTAILGLASRARGQGHWVVVHEDKLFDPDPSAPDLGEAELPVVEVILLRL